MSVIEYFNPPFSYLNLYKCFDALLSLNLTFKVCWRSKSHPPSQTQKWNWPRKIRRGEKSFLPLIFILFLLLIKTFKKSSEFFSRCVLAQNWTAIRFRHFYTIFISYKKWVGVATAKKKNRFSRYPKA